MGSQTIRHMIEDCADSGIRFPASASRSSPSSSRSAAHEEPAAPTEDLKSFDAEFVKVDQNTLFDLILAANYLDIKGMLDLTCQTVAEMIKGKTVEEIMKLQHRQ
ncbi:hypothetical protein ZWY2020_042040 [Hordeum vulgare]|nr:hypothetical protein ZWY2020_042040 [Hordeum vulgare]